MLYFVTNHQDKILKCFLIATYMNSTWGMCLKDSLVVFSTFWTANLGIFFFNLLFFYFFGDCSCVCFWTFLLCRCCALLVVKCIVLPYSHIFLFLLVLRLLVWNSECQTSDLNHHLLYILSYVFFIKGDNLVMIITSLFVSSL